MARVVVDLGADIPMACPAMWTLLYLSPETVTMYSALEGSKGRTLHYATAVTAVDLLDGNIIIVGAENVIWIPDKAQQESFLNVHHISNAGVVIDDRLWVHSGTQEMTVGRFVVPLDFVDQATTSFCSQHQTQEELCSTQPICISSRVIDPVIQAVARRKLAVDD